MENNLKLAYGAAVLGVLIGLAGLVFGLVAKNRVDALARDLSGAGQITAKVRSIESEMQSVSSSNARLSAQVKDLADQTQKAFDEVGSEFSRLRTQINRNTIASNELTQKVNELGRRPSGQVASAHSPAPADSGAATRSSGSSDNREATRTGDGRSYTIQPGDTFARIANRFNVSMDAVQAANPGVDPRRLQIGQEIQLPPGASR